VGVHPAVRGRLLVADGVDGTVYVGSWDETLYAVDAATGEREWVFTRPSRRVFSSPTVTDGTVYIGTEVSDDRNLPGTLYAVDAATGSQQWAFTQPSDSVSSSPTVVDDPESGDSVGSRVMLGTLGHHENSRYPTSGSGIDSGSGDGLGPGFGVGGALARLGGAGYLLKRRRSNNETDSS
jgi:WD-40 repeat-containing protein